MDVFLALLLKDIGEILDGFLPNFSAVQLFKLRLQIPYVDELEVYFRCHINLVLPLQ